MKGREWGVRVLDEDGRLRWRLYDPLEDVPGLFFRFAELYKHDYGVVRRWLDKYGFPGRYVRERWEKEEFIPGEREWEEEQQSIVDVIEQVNRAAAVFTMYEAVLDRDPEKAEK